MNRIVTIAAALLAFLPGIAHGQATQTARTYQGTDGQTREAQGTFCVPDTAGNGCPTGGSGASTPTGTAGSPNGAVVSVQGVSGGTNQNVAVAAALPAGSNSLGTVGLNAGSATIGSIANTGFTVTAALPAGANAIGTVALNAAIPAGANTVGAVNLNAGTSIIGNVRLDQTTPGTTNGVTMIPNTAAALGIAPATVASASSQVAKAAAGNFYGLNIDNAAVTGTYAVLYNATAAPAGGATLTASLILWHFLLPSGQSTDKVFPTPARCSTGCVVLYTTSLTTFTAPATAPLLSTVMVL